MRTRIGLFAIVSVLAVGAVYAQGDDERRLGVDLDATFVSKYMWRGYDVLEDDPAFQPSVNFDLFQTGFSVNVWGSFALESGWEDLDELDYSIAYERSFFEEERYAIDTWVNYIYYDFPNVSSEDSDVQELGLGGALPSLLPVGDSAVVPSYIAAYDWPFASGGPERGWFHILGLGYDLPITPLLPDQEEQAISFASDITYNDGVYGEDSCWSHATVGVSTCFEWKGFALTPSVNYQWSFEDAINDEDDFWATISVGYSF